MNDFKFKDAWDDDEAARRLRFAQMQQIIDRQEKHPGWRGFVNALEQKFSALIGCLGIVLATIAPVAVLNSVSAFILYLLWNWLLVSLFNAPVITYWQALGFIILLSVIGSFFKSSSSSSK